MSFDRSQAVHLTEAPDIPPVASGHRGFQRVKVLQVARWFNQLAVMLRAGIPLMQTIATLQVTEAHPRWRNTQQQILQGLQSGHAFSDCLAAYPRIFDAFSVRMTETGEQTGQLEVTLSQVAKVLEQRLALKRQLRQALTYPVCVLAVALLISVFMLTYVVPQFATLFQGNGATLPWLTRQLLHASDFVRSHALLLAIGAVAGTLLPLTLFPGLRIGILLRIPILRAVWREVAIARWCATLALTLRAGLPFLQGLALACANAQHPAFVRSLAGWSTAIEHGATLRDAFAGAGVFPPWALQMMAMGQESGSLDELLTCVGEFHAQSVDRTMAKLGTLLEPAVMVLMGGLVGTMLLALYLPVFQMSSAIG